jgi:hypothetical protein
MMLSGAQFCRSLSAAVGGCRRLSSAVSNYHWLIVVKELTALHWLTAAKFLMLEWCSRNICCCCFLVVSLCSPALYYVPIRDE